MEIPSDFQGQIKEVLIKEGDEVSEGMIFATMEVAVEEATKTETEETRPGGSWPSHRSSFGSH